MATPREIANQQFKDEIDRFAERMKQLIDDFDNLIKCHERQEECLARAIEEREKQK